MEFSRTGNKLASPSGIVQLMDDLGRAVAGVEEGDVCMLGGGNPARIPAVEQVWRRRMGELLADGDAFERLLVFYDPPQGNPAFLADLSAFLREQCGWAVGPENLAVTNGGQTAFFCLLNLLAGPDARGRRRRVLFPLMPEYIGYADQGLEPGLFSARRPQVEHTGPGRFKYHVDFDRLAVTPDIAALCVSRPTNPTGNVLTDTEIARLSALARDRGIPLLVDNAYGLPFPGIVFTDARPTWDENTVLTLSLSKLGLPGLRTGIVVARPEIIRALASMNAILSLANGSVGQALIRPLLAGGELVRLSREVIGPYYRTRCRQALEWFEEFFDPALDAYVHEPEGALFLWLWFPDLPITTRELYERLKRRRVLVVPGRPFFYGLDEDDRHPDECIRVTYSQCEHAVRDGMRIIAEEVARARREA